MKLQKHGTCSFAVLGAIILLCLLWFIGPLNFRDGGTSIPRRIKTNLRVLDGAVQSWALDHGYTNATTVTTDDVAPYIKDGWVRPVEDEEYVLRPFPQSPEAHLTHAMGSYRKGTIFRLVTNGGMEVIKPK